MPWEFSLTTFWLCYLRRMCSPQLPLQTKKSYNSSLLFLHRNDTFTSSFLLSKSNSMAPPNCKLKKKNILYAQQRKKAHMMCPISICHSIIIVSNDLLSQQGERKQSRSKANNHNFIEYQLQKVILKKENHLNAQKI